MSIQNTVWNLFEKTSLKYKNKECLFFPNTSEHVSWYELNSLSCIVANSLINLGLKKGDKLAVYGEISCFWVTFFLACAKAGIICILVSGKSGICEVTNILAKTEANYLVILGNSNLTNCNNILECVNSQFKNFRFLKKIFYNDKYIDEPTDNFPCVKISNLIKCNSKNENFKEVDPDDIFCIFTTSGSTGTPKLVHWSNADFIRETIFLKRNLPIDDNDILLFSTPLYCLAATDLLILALSTGAKIIALQHFSASKCAEIMCAEKVSIIFGVPSIFFSLSKNKKFTYYDKNLAYIHTAICFGDCIDECLIKKTIKKLNLRSFYDGYGCTEAGYICLTRYEYSDKLLLSNTVVSDFWDVKLDYDNPFFVSVVCTAYEVKIKSSKNGNIWVKTGDLGILRNNNIKIIGRIKNVIIKGGNNIFPSEIEIFLKKYDFIKEVRVFGIQDDFYGEDICICVTSDLDDPRTVEKNIRSVISENMSSDKIPKKILVLKFFPLLPSQKYDLVKLKEMAGTV